VTNPDPTSQQEPTPTGDALREYLEVVDQAVDAITGADVEADLASVLAKAGYDPGPALMQSELRLADFELTDLTDTTLDAAELECQLRATSAQLAKLQADVAATRQARRREMSRLHEAVSAADAAELRAAEAQERAHAAAVGAEAYVDTALDRAQEILDKARADAEQIVVEAQRQAAEITAAAARRPALSLYLPDLVRGGEALQSAWERETPPSAGHDDLLAGLATCVFGQRSTTPAADLVALGSGNILLVSNGTGKSAYLSALAGLLDPEALRCDVPEEEWGQRIPAPLALPAVNTEANYDAELDSTPVRWTWAALRSAMRRALAVSRLCGHSHPSAGESTPSTERPESETTEAGPVYQFRHFLLFVHKERSIQPAGDSDRHMTVADLVVDLTMEGNEGSTHRALCKREEHVSAQD